MIKKRDYKRQILEGYYTDSLYALVRDGFEASKGVKFKDNYATQLLCEYLELNIKGEIEWGLYGLPRGMGKSVFSSEFTPAFALLRDPYERIGCYSKKMSEDAKDWHEASYQIMTSEFTKDFINVDAVASMNKNVLRTHEGGYRRVASCLASSVGSDLTLAILDDPQGEDHVDSPAKRARLHNFFSNGLLRAIRKVDYTVLQNVENMQLTESQREEFELTLSLEKEETIATFKPARLIVTMQRLFEKDFFFYVEQMIKSMEEAGVHKPHTKLVIPAIHEQPKLYIFPVSKQTYQAKANEFTLAGTLTERGILQAKAQMHPSKFNAQMQQDPRATEGRLIEAHWFNHYTQEELPSNLRLIMTTDFATSESINADFTVCAVWGISDNKDIYLLDMRRMQGGGLKVDTMFDNMVTRWQNAALCVSSIKNPNKAIQCMIGGVNLRRIYIENVSNSQRLIMQYRVKYGNAIETLARTKGKFARLLDVGGVIESKKVFLPADDVLINGESLKVIKSILIEECQNFREESNSYDNDDCVDTLIDACYIATLIRRPTIFDATVHRF